MALLRNCLACGQVDDHPRHVIALADGSDVAWHNDCHARATNCAVCIDVVASANGRQGDELRSHILAHDPGQTAALALNAAQQDHFRQES